MKLSAIRKRLDSLPTRDAAFIEPMECLAITKLPTGPGWVYEIKLDGYRAVAVNSKGKLNLCSRIRKSFHGQYPYIIDSLSDLPENAVVDGEVVALDDEGQGQISRCFSLVAPWGSRTGPSVRLGRTSQTTAIDFKAPA